MNIIIRLINATRYSLSGIAAAWKHEQAFRLDVAACLIAIIGTIVIPIQPYEKHMLILLALLLLVVELLNTAIEAVVNRISDEQHDLSKIAKDCGSAAVFMVIVMNVVAWGFALSSLRAYEAIQSIVIARSRSDRGNPACLLLDCRVAPQKTRGSSQ